MTMVLNRGLTILRLCSDFVLLLDFVLLDPVLLYPRGFTLGNVNATEALVREKGKWVPMYINIPLVHDSKMLMHMLA